MAIPWKNKRNVLSDLDELCDFNIRHDGKILKDIKLLTMEKIPSPIPIDDDYLPYGVDLTGEDESFTKPNLDFITSMLRCAAPNYSNDKIEEAFGYQGLLLDKGAESSSAQSVQSSANVTMSDENPHLKLNPESPEFVPHTNNNKTVSQNQIIPCISSCENVSSQSADLNRHARASNVDNASNSHHYMESISDPPSPISNRIRKKSPSTVEPTKQAFAHLSSPALNRKIKRNCVMQSMFERFSLGEPQKPLENIQVNDHFLSAFGAHKPNKENAPSKDLVAEVTKPETEIVESQDVTDESSDESNDSLSKDIPQNVSHSKSADKLSSDASNSSSSQSGRVISISAKNKVLDWLSQENKAKNKKNSPPLPKPIPVKLGNDAFQFKITKKDERVVNVETKASPSHSNWRSSRQESQTSPVTNKKTQLDGTQGAKNATKSLSVQEIYNNLKANQTKAKIAKAESQNYSNFMESNNKISSTSNTLWDNIEKQLKLKK